MRDVVTCMVFIIMGSRCGLFGKNGSWKTFLRGRAVALNRILNRARIPEMRR